MIFGKNKEGETGHKKPAPRIFQRDVYYKGQVIVKQGATGRNAYYIERGKVEVLMAEGEHEVVISTLGAGSVFGEMALIAEEVRSATVRAKSDCTVIVISEADLEKKLSTLDKAMAALMRVFVERLRDADEGIFHHYKNFAEFHDRIQGLTENVSKGVPEENRARFKEEVSPILEDLDMILQKYQQD